VRPHLRAPHACARTPHKRPRIRHVIVVVLENHPYPKIIGRAPFITALAHRCGLAANYHHNARVSLPNYLAMTSGSTHGLRRNCTPKQCPIGGPSLFTHNLCHDMHDCSVAVGDRWISRWVRMMVRSRAYRAGHTAIFLTFDEGSNRVGCIPTVVVSPYTHSGTVSHRRYTHFSLMRTTARVLGIRRCLGKACSARGLSKAFRL
jgi:hypothetical protein